jgi:hypothetical protein
VAHRRKNPESTGFYIALAAGGALLYLLLRKGSTPAALPPGGNPPIGSDPLGIGTGTGGGGVDTGPNLLPAAEAEQFQTNINTLLNRFGETPITVDGKFGPRTFATWTRIRTAGAQIAEIIQRHKTTGDHDFLSDPGLFYDPPAGAQTYRLYNTQEMVALGGKVIDRLCRKPISLSAADLQALR